MIALASVELGADLGDDAHQRIAAADLHHLGLAAVEQIAIQLVGVGVLVLGGLVDHGDIGSERRGPYAAIGAIGRRLQDGADDVARGGRVGVSKILGGFGNELIDVVGTELDPILFGNHAIGEIGYADADGLRSLGGVVTVAADRR